MFEDEYRQMQLNPIKIEYLLKDTCMLLPPTATPLSGVEFIKRLPSGDIERARRVKFISKKLEKKTHFDLILQSIRVFFLIRSLYLELNRIQETQLPLIRPENLLRINDKIDLSKRKKILFVKINFNKLDNGDLIACVIHMKER